VERYQAAKRTLNALASADADVARCLARLRYLADHQDTPDDVRRQIDEWGATIQTVAAEAARAHGAARIELDRATTVALREMAAE
jgi:hypothetical protein